MNPNATCSTQERIESEAKYRLNRYKRSYCLQYPDTVSRLIEKWRL